MDEWLGLILTYIFKLQEFFSRWIPFVKSSEGCVGLMIIVCSVVCTEEMSRQCRCRADTLCFDNFNSFLTVFVNIHNLLWLWLYGWVIIVLEL